MPTIEIDSTGISSDTGWDEYTLADGSVGFETHTGSINALFSSMKKEWSRTEGYRSKVARGERLPDLPFFYRRRNRITGSIELIGVQSNVDSWVLKHKFKRAWPVENVPMLDLVSKIEPVELTNKLLENARGQSSQLPVSVLEGRKTAEMVFQTASRLAGSYRHLRRGRFMEAARSLGIGVTERDRIRYQRQFGRNPSGAAANQWLQWQYGWKPLLADVHATASTLASIRDAEWANRMRAQATIRRTTQFKRRHLLMASPEVWATVTGEEKHSMRGVWDFKPNSWAPYAQLGLTNPLLVVWDSVPLSFVADWFYPLGDYLSALDTPFYTSHVGGCIGDRKEVKFTFSEIDSKLYNLATGSASGSQFQLSRTPIRTTPSVELSEIRFDPKLGAQRAISGIALLVQAFGRRR